jgi:hypothetical protein
VGDLLGTSRQAAHHRFARWAQRYLPFVMVAIPDGRPMPANPAEARARLSETTDLSSDDIDAMHQAIALVANRSLDIITEPPP